MQAVHIEIQPGQLVAQGGGGKLGVAEDHHPLISAGKDDLGQIGQLIPAGGAQQAAVPRPGGPRRAAAEKKACHSQP